MVGEELPIGLISQRVDVFHRLDSPNVATSTGRDNLIAYRQVKENGRGTTKPRWTTSIEQDGVGLSCGLVTAGRYVDHILGNAIHYALDQRDEGADGLSCALGGQGKVALRRP